MPVNLSDDQRGILLALLESGSDFMSVESLASRISKDYERVQDMLLDLDMLGFIQFWERDEGLAFTLSPLGAEMLGVCLVEIEDERSVWVYRNEKFFVPLRAKGVLRRDISFDLFESDKPGPVQMAMEREEFFSAVKVEAKKGWLGRKKYDNAGLPYPTVLLAKNVDTPLGEQCDCCEGGTLKEYTYCLKCDRWGMDGRFLPGKHYKEAPPEKTKQVVEKVKAKVKAKSEEIKAKYKEKQRKYKEERERIRQGLKRAPRQVA